MILDIACGSYICKSLQGLQKIKSLNKGDFELYGMNGQPIQTEAVGTYILLLRARHWSYKTVIIYTMSLKILFLYPYYWNMDIK